MQILNITLKWRSFMEEMFEMCEMTMVNWLKSWLLWWNLLFRSFRTTISEWRLWNGRRWYPIDWLPGASTVSIWNLMCVEFSFYECWNTSIHIFVHTGTPVLGEVWPWGFSFGVFPSYAMALPWSDPTDSFWILADMFVTFFLILTESCLDSRDACRLMGGKCYRSVG